jgi:4-amino-4-deoxy-L-arabinose transferase-like glycosyltransferase
MYQSSNFVVPTFNYKLRIDKPVLLYWLQVSAYYVFGINEFAARFPSAFAALLAVLVTYELGRLMFACSTALLGAVILATSIAVGAAAHFANPDALLNLCTLLSLWCFWKHYRGDRGWWLTACGTAIGLGILAKGPVALLLPLTTIISFLLLRREIRGLWDLRILGAAFVTLMVAAPWYIWVGIETKGEWLTGFFWKHNVERTLGTLENHSGPFFYYGLALIAGMMPWSIFLGPTFWHAWKRIRLREQLTPMANEVPAESQFLLCWTGAWIVFFTLVRTKLPNYILPAYPAVALLTASFLDDWKRGRITLANWVMPASLACLTLAGISVSVGLLIVGDAIPLRLIRHPLPGLEKLAWVGGVLLVGSLLAGLCYFLGRRVGFLLSIAIIGLCFSSALSLWGVNNVDQYKAPRALAELLPRDQLQREVRIGAFGYFQPSLVFYCQREVYCPENPICALELLHMPLPVYFFVSSEMWDQLRPFAPTTYRLVARHGDLYSGRDILLVTNEAVR